MAEIPVMRTMGDLLGVNTLVLATVPLRFQLAPGTAAGLGIANADYTIAFAGEAPFASGQTDADGEVPVPMLAIITGNVTAFGKGGPDANLAGMDLVVQARGGLKKELRDRLRDLLSALYVKKKAAVMAAART